MTYTPFKYRQLSHMILRIQLRLDFNTVLLFAKYITRAIYNLNHAHSCTVLNSLFYSCSMQLRLHFNTVLLFAKYITRAIYNFNHAHSCTALYNLFYSDLCLT